jgi:hypothetical protein
MDSNIPYTIGTTPGAPFSTPSIGDSGERDASHVLGGPTTISDDGRVLPSSMAPPGPPIETSRVLFPPVDNLSTDMNMTRELNQTSVHSKTLAGEETRPLVRSPYFSPFLPPISSPPFPRTLGRSDVSESVTRNLHQHSILGSAGIGQQPSAPPHFQPFHFTMNFIGCHCQT